MECAWDAVLCRESVDSEGCYAENFGQLLGSQRVIAGRKFGD